MFRPPIPIGTFDPVFAGATDPPSENNKQIASDGGHTTPSLGTDATFTGATTKKPKRNKRLRKQKFYVRTNTNVDEQLATIIRLLRAILYAVCISGAVLITLSVTNTYHIAK